VPLLSLDEIPPPHFPNFDDNAFDTEDFNLELTTGMNEKLVWNTLILCYLTVVRACIEDYSSDDSYTTCQSKYYASVEIMLYQVLLKTYDISIDSMGPHPPLLCRYDDRMIDSDAYECSRTDW
jgi:hypothetical protein